ncbi:MAG: flavodoxin family protein [Nitrososphaerota archaeon]|nr:flavodoxin family protein [Candidatus Bathyarchaeota archaeon]MCX8162724.1 flavodoxin family protein [Candidatus Bathyarchaeota archaeon]MDW8062147.1 flavodoxin family protein [Nitrososphaerota archaeon]
MIRILAIVGSPRIGGNTEILASEALKAAAEEGVETEMVRLAEKEVKPCDACLSCRVTRDCRIRDDFQGIFDRMVEADGIILATPVYFGSATPQIMALIDRAGYLSMARGRVFENKVGGGIVVARRAGQNFTLAQLIFFFLHQGMIVPGSTYWTIAFGREKGDVVKDVEGVNTVRNMAKKMVWLIRKIKGID